MRTDTEMLNCDMRDCINGGRDCPDVDRCDAIDTRLEAFDTMVCNSMFSARPRCVKCIDWCLGARVCARDLGHD